MKKIIFFVFFMLLLTGCADYKEINEMAIVSGIGIDYQNDEYVVTLEILNEKSGKDKITTYIRTGKDQSLATALEKTADKLSHRAYYPHVKLVVISEEIAKNHLQDVADFFIRSTYLRENFNIVVSKDIKPEDVYTITTDENPIASSAILLLLQTNAFASNYAIDKKFYVFLQEMVDFGKDGSISIISMKEKDFYINGLALFKDYQMKNIISNENASLYNILRNELRKPVFSLTYEGKTFTIAIFDTKSETKITKDEINIAGVYRAKIMNNGPNFDIKNVDILNTLDEDFSKLLNEEITKFIEELQKNDTDILGFANKYYIKSRDKNDKLWQNAKINTDIKVIINKKGLVYSIYEND